MNKSIPPFYVGQRVVAIKDHSQGVFKKGDEFTVTMIRWGCCEWEISVGIRPVTKNFKCLKCGAIGIEGIERVFSSSSFAPILPAMQKVTFSEIMIKEPACVN